MRLHGRGLAELGAAPCSVSLAGGGVDEVVAGGRAAVVGEPGGFGERLGVAVGGENMGVEASAKESPMTAARADSANPSQYLRKNACNGVGSDSNA